MPYNSTITKKKCKRDGCNRYPTMGLGGWCWEHSPEEIKSKHKNKQDLARKNKVKRVTLSRQLHKAQSAVDTSQEDLQTWFRIKMNSAVKRCENCGKSLLHYNQEDWFGSQDHLLEKSLFPSLASHPENYLCLCKWGCHPQKHTSMLNFSKMAIFEKAKAIVRKLYPLLPPEEKRKVSPYYEITE